MDYLMHHLAHIHSENQQPSQDSKVIYKKILKYFSLLKFWYTIIHITRIPYKTNQPITISILV